MQKHTEGAAHRESQSEITPKGIKGIRRPHLGMTNWWRCKKTKNNVLNYIMNGI